MEWKGLFKDNILRGGQEYLNSNSVHNVSVSGNEISGDVSGIDNFHVSIKTAGDGIETISCSCPLAQTGAKCKHMAAVLFAWEQQAPVVEEPTPVSQPQMDIRSASAEVEPERPDQGNDMATSPEEEVPAEELSNTEPQDSDAMKEDSGEVHKDSSSVAPENTTGNIEIAPPTMFGEENKTEEVVPVPDTFTAFTPRYDGRIELQADINTFFSYALQQNRVAIVRTVTIKNASEEDIENLAVRVWTDVDLIDTYVEKIDVLTAGEEHCFRNLKIMVHGDFLASLTERISCVLYVVVTKGTEELARQSEEIAVLAFDQWPGFPRYFPDLLAAFITPNHPAMAGLLQAASKYLQTWTDNPSLEGYQSGDPNRILAMAGAAYAAIQKKNITYSSAPASFEDMGQRVRLVDQILEQHFGTCLDMTLLYAGLLEAMHLNPILVMRSGHIFAGVWIVDDTFPDPWTDDPSQLEKRLADGVNEVVVVECTAMCSGYRDFLSG